MAERPENHDEVEELNEDPREVRKRRGCRNILLFVIGFVLVLALAGIVAWFYSGTSSFARYVERKIEANLETKLQRNVEIGGVEIVRGRTAGVILTDVRIANVEEASHPWFMIIPRAVIEGGIESFQTRTVTVDTVLIENPRVFIEFFPEGSDLLHNIPSWTRSQPRSYEIARFEVSEIAIDEGELLYQDQRQEIRIELAGLDSRLSPDIDQGAVDGVFVAKRGLVVIREMNPLELKFRSGFSYADGALHVKRFRAEGRGFEASADGKMDPVRDGVYDFDIVLTTALERIKELTGATAELDGEVHFDGTLEGSRGDYLLSGELRGEHVEANAYALEDLSSRLIVEPGSSRLEIARARYAGGVVSGTWRLESFQEPQPMSVDLDLDGVVLESVLADWNVGDSGLRGRASGSLRYSWNGPDLLTGSGSGSLAIAPGSVAFSQAPYPFPVSGELDLSLETGEVSFTDSVLRTPDSRIAFEGSLLLEDLVTDFDVRIETDDFSEIDRLAVNFARSAGNRDADLLGLAGQGTLVGSLSGPMSAIELTATINGTGVRYNDAPLGNAQIRLGWDGSTETLRFIDADFRRDGATMELAGTILFPDGGPLFDLEIDVDEWDVSNALDVVDLDLNINGHGTGTILVKGTPEDGDVLFRDLRIVDGEAALQANGSIQWLPGDVTGFDLDLEAENWDAAETIAILGLDLNVTGLATGNLQVTGTTDRGTVIFDDLIIRENGSRIALRGETAWLPGEGEIDLDLSLGAETLSLDALLAFLDLGDLPLEGELSGSLTLQGPKDDLRGAGSVIIRNGRIFDEPVELITADLDFTDQRVDLDHIRLEAPVGVVEGEASWSFADESFSYVIEPTVLDLSEIESFDEMIDVMDGNLWITSSGAGTFQSPEFVLEASLQEGVISGRPLPEDQAAPTVFAAIRNGELTIEASAFGSLEVDGSGSVTEQGDLDGVIRILGQDMATLASILFPGSGLPLDGSFRADLDIGGELTSLEAVELKGVLSELELLISGEEVTTVRPIQFALDDGMIVLDDVELRTAETNFFVDGVIPVFSEEPISLTLRGTIDATMAQAFMPELRATGQLIVRADVAGALSSPRIAGTVEIRNASARFSTLPQTISQIYGTILFRGNRIEIDSLRANIGGGEIVAGGFIIHEGFSPGRLRLTARGTDVTIRYFDGVTVAGDFDLALNGDQERMVLRGNYLVDQGLYYKDLDFASTIVDRLITREVVTPRVSAGWQNRVALSIDVTANDTLRVRNNLANLSASANLEVVGTLANPVILGRVTLNEGGEITFQDVDYRIVQGTISFQNPFRNDPYFDITAEGLMSARGQSLGEVEEYELTVNLTGTLDQITPNITSEPPLGDVTLLTLLAGEVAAGQQALGGGRTLTGAGTEFLLSSVGEAIGSRILPFADSFRLESVGSDGTFSPTVTLEKQISDDLFVIVIYDTSSTRNIEIIQWQAAKDWIVQFTRDSEKEDNGWVLNAIDARFRKRYGGRW